MSYVHSYVFFTFINENLQLQIHNNYSTSELHTFNLTSMVEVVNRGKLCMINSFGLQDLYTIVPLNFHKHPDKMC